MIKKVITVATIQLNSEPNSYSKNLNSAELLIREAVEKKAELVVLPELFAVGYAANKSIFSLGETTDGPTLTWMRELSKKHNVFIGGGIPIYENDHLYNRFYICNPNGNVCGYAQKQYGESYCFKRDEGIFKIDTELGQIGVSICADTHFSATVSKLQNLNIDILLMPHAWPTLESGSQDEWDFSTTIANLLNIPVVFINGVGKIEPMQGVMGKLMPPSKFRLRGKSCIINANGQTINKLSGKPGILVENVTLGKISNKQNNVPNYDGWVHPGSRLLRNIIIPFDIWRGKRVYNRNRFLIK